MTVRVAVVTETGKPLAWRARVADRFLERLVGWIGRRTIPPGDGLLLPDVRIVHTIGVRPPIDVAFLDREGRVVGLRRRLGPWRVARGPRGTAATLELPPGGLAAAAVRPGQRVVLVAEVEKRDD